MPAAGFWGKGSGMNHTGIDATTVWPTTQFGEPAPAVDATPWQDKSGHWHSKGTPTCLVSGLTTPTKVTVGLVDVASANSAPGRTVVVWMKCYT